ncbi:hypothetical protein FDP41_004240 [Naegleria fowleri]|uniref:Uncharacterized protein n=1 Tax=Naegleria fowleri TaxID=5763 RepID=A0A6A5BUE1_NAEFO|nr:uncharacterized protein FDP41_004240 [Naegleria fowleri]KAF0976945.1 hypothetical protein FDP41_004240 [Naegleria fowleri]CAG4716007.1 unnamed protein product [Naegleria fowleri]
MMHPSFSNPSNTNIHTELQSCLLRVLLTNANMRSLRHFSSEPSHPKKLLSMLYHLIDLALQFEPTELPLRWSSYSTQLPNMGHPLLHDEQVSSLMLSSQTKSPLYANALVHDHSQMNESNNEQRMPMMIMDQYHVYDHIQLECVNSSSSSFQSSSNEPIWFPPAHLVNRLFEGTCSSANKKISILDGVHSQLPSEEEDQSLIDSSPIDKRTCPLEQNQCYSNSRIVGDSELLTSPLSPVTEFMQKALGSCFFETTTTNTTCSFETNSTTTTTPNDASISTNTHLQNNRWLKKKSSKSTNSNTAKLFNHSLMKMSTKETTNPTHKIVKTRKTSKSAPPSLFRTLNVASDQKQQLLEVLNRNEWSAERLASFVTQWKHTSYSVHDQNMN